MSTDSTETVVNEPSNKPSRNPIERVLVWGLIGALLVVAGIEGRAQRGYTMSLDAFQTAFADAEEVHISLGDARNLIALSPSEVKAPHENGPNHLYAYYHFSWFSLFKSDEYKIILKVTDDNELTVISFATPAAPLPEWMQPVTPQPGDSGSEDSGLNDGGASDGRGFGDNGGNRFDGRSFQPPPNPLVTKLDVDGNGELSAEEIEGSPAVLESLDTNGDGELTIEEFDPEGLGRRGGGRESDPGSSRPRRPEIEE